MALDPTDTTTRDIVITAHRGYWGQNLGTGAPENTLAAVDASMHKGYFIIEIDAQLTSDGKQIAIHDYRLNRLTTVTDANQYVAATSYATLTGLTTKLRNGVVASAADFPVQVDTYTAFTNTVKLLDFDTLFKYVLLVNSASTVPAKPIIIIDVKEPQAHSTNGVCDAFCAGMTPSYTTAAEQNAGWAAVVKGVLAKADLWGVLSQVVIKSHLKYDGDASGQDVTHLLGTSTSNYYSPYLKQVTWMPVIYDAKLKGTNDAATMTNIITFINTWQASGLTILAYEPTCKNEYCLMLKDKDDGVTVSDDNVFNYIMNTAGRRTAFFAGDPVSRQGIADRWGDSRMTQSGATSSTDTGADRRADMLWLLSLPGGNHMVMTTDAPDPWAAISTAPIGVSTSY